MLEFYNALQTPVVIIATLQAITHCMTVSMNRNNERISLVIWATQPAGGLKLKKLKYLEVMLNTFEFSRMWKNVRSWLVYANKLFFLLLRSLSFNVLTVTNFLYFNKTKKFTFIYIALDCNSYRCIYKFAFILFLSFLTNQKQQSGFHQVCSLVTRNIFFVVYSEPSSTSKPCRIQ